MKKLLTALLCGAAVLLSADVLKEWNFKEAKVPGLQYPYGNITYCISPEVKTPEGDPVGEFVIKKVAKRTRLAEKDFFFMISPEKTLYFLKTGVPVKPKSRALLKVFLIPISISPNTLR